MQIQGNKIYFWYQDCLTWQFMRIYNTREFFEIIKCKGCAWLMNGCFYNMGSILIAVKRGLVILYVHAKRYWWNMFFKKQCTRESQDYRENAENFIFIRVWSLCQGPRKKKCEIFLSWRIKGTSKDMVILRSKEKNPLSYISAKIIVLMSTRLLFKQSRFLCVIVSSETPQTIKL